ncbi:hypothetical protein D3C81_294090 [compost metagenome]
MGIALLAVEEAAQPERAGEGALDRLVEQQVAGLGGAEGLVGQGLLGQFPVDAGHVLGQRIDLTGVFELDVLLTIMLVADREAQGAAIVRGHLMGAGLALERDADDGDPALALFLHHQDGFVLIPHGGRLGAVSQLHHGHASRHRVVEQTADKAGFGVKSGTAEQHEKEEQVAHGGSIEQGGEIKRGKMMPHSCPAVRHLALS